jgi:hypothetical protein
MIAQTRQLARDGIQWSVREADAARTPGARGKQCLIFDSDIIVRRVWTYPASWMELDDDALWECVGATERVVVTPPSSEVHRAPEHTAIALAAEATARTRSLLTEIMLLREANESLRRETHELICACHQRRADMRRTIESYAAAMRQDGLPPEQALRLIKGAVTLGLKPVVASEDPDAELVVSDAVAWGIAAYFAA